MPKATGPASIKALENLHRKTVRALNMELDRIAKAKEPVPAALLNAATALLKVTGITQPKANPRRTDRLAGLLDSYAADEDGDGTGDKDASTDFTGRDDPPRDQ